MFVEKLIYKQFTTNPDPAQSIENSDLKIAGQLCHTFMLISCTNLNTSNYLSILVRMPDLLLRCSVVCHDFQHDKRPYPLVVTTHNNKVHHASITLHFPTHTHRMLIFVWVSLLGNFLMYGGGHAVSQRQIVSSMSSLLLCAELPDT